MTSTPLLHPMMILEELKFGDDSSRFELRDCGNFIISVLHCNFTPCAVVVGEIVLLLHEASMSVARQTRHHVVIRATMNRKQYIISNTALSKTLQKHKYRVEILFVRVRVRVRVLGLVFRVIEIQG